MNRLLCSHISSFIFNFILFFVIQPTFASIQTDLSVKFYRSTKSPFPSGQLHRLDLEKSKIREFSDCSFLVEKENQQFLLPMDKVRFDLLLSTFVLSKKDKKKYQVLDTKDFWLLVKKKNDENRIWLPMQDLVSAPGDLGLAMFLTSAPLKFSPNSNSSTKLYVEPKSLWKILKWFDDWVLVRDVKNPDNWGYAEIKTLLLKHDFANFVMTSSKKWIPVKHRQGSEMLSIENKSIPLKDITNLITNPNLAVSTEPSVLGQHLTIKKWIEESWIVSSVKAHGEVFWKKPPSSTKTEVPETLLTEDLLKREVFSVSFSPKNSQHGIVSSHGIYLTQDNLRWKKLTQFQNNNQPVLITGDGVIYVGDQRSSDNGKTFSSYFKWDQILSTLSSTQKSEFRGLKIITLESSTSENLILLTLTTGTRKIRLAGTLQDGSIQSWALR